MAELLAGLDPPGWDGVPEVDGPADPAEVAGVAVGWTRVFVTSDGSPGLLLVTAWDPADGIGSGPWVRDLLSEPMSDERPWHVGEVDGGRGLRASAVVDGQETEAFALYADHGRIAVEVAVAVPAPVDEPTVAWARDLVGAVVDELRAVPPLPELAPAVPQHLGALDAVVVDGPGEWPVDAELHHLPGAGGALGPDLVRRLGVDDRVGAIPQPSEFGGWRAVQRRWGTPLADLEVTVQVWDLGGDRSAGAWLGGLATGARPPEADQGERAVLAEAGLDDVVVLRGPGADGLRVVALAARRGGMGVIVASQAPGPDMVEPLASLLRRQLGALPAGSTEMAVPSSSLPTTVGYAAAALILMLAVRSIAVARARAPGLVLREPLPERTLQVSGAAAELRRSGRPLATALYVSLGLVLVGVQPQVIGLLGPVPAVLGLSGLLVVVTVARRRSRPAGTPRQGMRRPRAVRTALGTTVGLGAVVVALSAVAALGALGGIEANPSFGDDQASVLRGIAVVAWLGGLGGAVVVLRFSRRQARLRAAEVRRLDARRPVLFLRGFRDDLVRVPAFVSGRRPVLEWLLPSVRDSFEVVVTWASAEVGPPIAIAPPGARLASLGAAREPAYPEDAWLGLVTKDIEGAAAVVVCVDRTDGLLAELEAIRGSGALSRTVLVIPPVPPHEARARWAAAAPLVGLEGPGGLVLDPAQTLAVVAGPNGAVAVTADRRDEAGYRAAVEAALELASRGGWPAPPRPLPPPPPVSVPNAAGRS